MKKYFLALLTTLVTTCLFTACGTQKNKNLQGDWLVQSVQGVSNEKINKSAPMTMYIDLPKHYLGGKGVCNTYGCEFELTQQGTFTSKGVIATRVGCDNIQKEMALFEAIEKTKKLTLKENIVLFQSADGSVLISLKRAPQATESK